MVRLASVFLLALIASSAGLPSAFAEAPAGPACAADYAQFSGQAAIAKAEGALGKSFSKKQIEAIAKANELIPEAAYSAGLIGKQEKILRKAKLKPQDIQELRRQHALTNTRFELAGDIPEQARVIELSLKPIDAAALAKKKELPYVVDSAGNLFVVEGKANLTPDTLWLVQNKNSASDELHLIKEAGMLHADGKNGVKLEPRFDLDTTREELMARVGQLEGNHPTMKVNKEALAHHNHAQVLRCVDMMAKNTSMKSALLQRFIADNIMMATAMGVSEAGGAGRLLTAEGRQVIMADFIGSNINSVIGAFIGKYLVQSKRSLPVSLLVRSAVAMGMIEVQKNVYKQVLDKNPEERASKIANFDRYYFFARLPIAHYADQFILKKLPELLFEACKKDSKVAMYITPGRVRIAERAGSTIFYYGLRSAMVSE